MLTYLLFALFILSCVVLIVAVLLQPGKADAGALFTSSVSTTAFGPRGTQSLLAKITIAAAAVFMLSALLLSFGVGGPRSLMEGATGPAATPTPAVTATPQGDAAPAASPQQDGSAAPAASPAAGDSAPPAASPAAQPSPETK